LGAGILQSQRPVKTLLRLFEGKNLGKQLLEIAEPEVA
jgi:hypothetical protein